MSRYIRKSCSILQGFIWTRTLHLKVDGNNCLQKLSPQVSAALVCGIHADNSKHDGQQEKSTVASVACRWQQCFEKEGISEPIESIEHIIAHVLGTAKITDMINLSEKELDTEQLKKIELLCECRISRMPVQYIIGEWSFRDITLKLEPPIFIPRPETEILVDFVLKRIANIASDKTSVLEIGCGSGAISLSLLHSNKNINLVAIDVDSQACELTIRNARDLRLDNRLTVLNAELTENGAIEMKKQHLVNQDINVNEDKFNFIVSNPPYIPTKEIFKLQPEIKLYEDIKALDGGDDGLKIIRPILKYASQALNTGGFLILEVDSRHPQHIQFLVEKYYSKQLKFAHVHKDFCNNDRIVEILKIE